MTAAENIGIAARTGKAFKFTRSRANAVDTEFFPGTGSTLHFANRDTDTFTARNIPAGLLLAGDTVTVQYKAPTSETWSTVFSGEVDRITDRHGGNAERVQDVVVAGPWNKLSRLVFRQTWGAGNIAFTSSRVILGQQEDGTAQHMKAQIAEIVGYAVTNGCGISLGNNYAPEQYLPLDEARDITCADAIRRELRFFPKLVVRFDYSGPALQIVDIDHAATASYAASAPNTAREYVYNAHPVKYVDVTVDAVEMAVNGDSVTYHQFYPTPPSGTTPPPLDVLHVTVPLAKGGGSTTSESFKIESEPMPGTQGSQYSGLDDKSFWIAKHPRLKDVLANELSFTTTPTRSPSHYNYIVENSKDEILAAGKHCEVSRFQCKVKISTTDDEEDEILLTMDFLTTDAPSGTYTVQTGSTATAGETLPAGLAQALYEQRSQSLLSESVTIRLNGTFPSLGDKLVETVGSSTETLFLQSFDVDVADETARLSFGQPEHLSAEDMKSLLNGFRQRGSASTAVLREQKGAEEGEEPDAPGGIPPIASSEWKPGTKIKTALKKSSGGTIKMDATSAGTIDLQTTHVGNGQPAQFRDLTYTDSNGRQQTVKFLSTAAATIPPGGSAPSGTPVDVLAGISSAEFNSTSKQLEVKFSRRKVYVLSVDKTDPADLTLQLPLYENDVVVGSDYNDSVQHVFNNFTRKGVITGSDSQPTTASVFTSTAHSAE